VNDYAYNGNTAPDVVYSYTAPLDQQVTWTLCGSDYDSYLYVYDGTCVDPPIAFSDDDNCNGVFTSQSTVTCVQLAANHTYYIVVDGWSSSSGAYSLLGFECLPCTPICPPGALQENEPNCGDEYVDVTDGGCNSDPAVFIPITCGQVVCGTTGTYLYTGLQYRDTDWYELTLTSPMTVTWKTVGDFANLVFIIQAPCPGTIIASATAARCDTATVSAVCNPGTYYLWVGPSVFTGIPCGTQYVGVVTCEPYVPPVGRCCYGTDPNNPLCEVDAQFECTNLGGQWTQGIDCTTPCPLRPINDDCGSAVPVSLPATFTGTTEAATVDCPALGYAEVWHAFTTTECMDVTLSYCGTNPPFANVYIVLVPDCPCSGTWTLASTWTQSCADGNWEVFWGALPAGTWYVPVLSDPVDAYWDYTISATGVACPPPPPNDNCGDVTPVTLPATINGDNSGATEDCNLLGWQEVWEAFTITQCMDVTIDFCGSATVFPTVGIVLVNGCPCGSYTVASDYNWADCGDGNVTMHFPSTAAGTYYYPIYSAAGNTGPYTMHITGVACPPPPPDCPAGGDNCADVITIPACPFRCAGSTVGAVADYPPSCLFTPGPDRIYKLTTQAVSSIHADLCGTGTNYDTGIEIRTGGTCPGTTSLACDDDTCGLHSAVTVSSQPAGTYYIIITGYNGASGSYWLNVTADPCFSTCTPDSVSDLVAHLVNADADPRPNDIALYWTADPTFTQGTYDVYRSAVVNDPFPGGSWTAIATNLVPVQGPSANTYIDYNAVPLNGAREYYLVVGVCPQP